MHKKSRRGQSHSTRPAHPRPPSWLSLTPDEIEIIIEQLAQKGYTPSQIGLILRDQFGVPLVKPILGKSITDALSEKGLEPKIPEDLFNLMKKAVNLRRHLQEHPKDFDSKRGLVLTESKIRRLVRYYKTVGKIPQDWEYDPERAKLLVAGSS
ncbi:30S ribosomal protein S15 [Acidilobus sp. 7A]|jgi:small subunit ribosomal protein S15|uniref:30S ribosomal protein S15 n=1 Tax=Acidilobus sp. 7A TaxID=1577685 RepID=UPI000764D935|nr:30S ribosomal protein S15 [Acidilobus sp. 7A]AMD30993.1 30S ribosomal protein S15 [Acidilobus sp. 7A]